MTKQIIIDGVDVSGCEYFFDRACMCSGNLTLCGSCVKNPNCYYKQLQRKTAECEKLKEKLKPKIKNAHCAYFEGQTGMCRAKEFKRCNPVNCKLYTIDELSTILDLQKQLERKTEGCEQLKQELTELKKSGSELLAEKNAFEIGMQQWRDKAKELEAKLQRKTAECEKIKKFLGISSKPIMTRLEELNEIHQDLKIQNDELKNKLQLATKVMNKILNITFHKDYTLSANIANEEIKIIHNELEKAFEALERIKE